MEVVLSNGETKRKIIRYKHKGYGKIVAILSTIIFFTLIPSIVAPAIWPTKIENEKRFYAIFFITWHESVYFFCNIAMYFVYISESKFLDRYKIHNYEWPWKVNKAEWINLLKQSILVIGFNQLIIIPLFTILNLLLNERLQIRLEYESLPSIFETFWQIAFFMIVEDFMFYWCHRFLHWGPIYPYIHKVHHHYRNTISFCSEYVHPVEFVFGNIIPSNFGIIILKRRSHAVTYAMWIFIRLFKTTEAHSGYEFSWSPIALLPFQIPSEFHNFHHSEGFNGGNFGSFFKIWDTLGNTVHPTYLERKKTQKEFGDKDE